MSGRGKSKNRIEMGENKWAEYQESRKRHKARDWQRNNKKKSNHLIFRGRKIKDITGFRSGKLVAVRPVDPEEKYNNKNRRVVLWECKCDCGQTLITRTSRITGRERKSCGCLRNGGKDRIQRGHKANKYREVKAEAHEYFGNISKRYYHSIESAAKKRGKAFDVSIKYLNDIFEKQKGICPFTGDELIFGTGKDWQYRTASLDRIDNDKDYVEGNIRWVHKDVNILRGSRTDEKFLKYCYKARTAINKICKYQDGKGIGIE